jgi:separase
MSTEDDIDKIKIAISSCQANDETVRSLQYLLCLTPKPNVRENAIDTRPAVRSGPSARSRNADESGHQSSQTANGSRGSKKPQQNTVELAPKTRFALATDIVNLALKVLTHSSKRREAQTDAVSGISPNVSKVSARDTPEATRPNKVPQDSRKALSADAEAAPQLQRKRGSGQASPVACDKSYNHVVCTAEIARMGFLYLRSVDTTKHGLRAPQRLKLESGTLALVVRLSALHLDSLAVKELFALKKMLEGSSSMIKIGTSKVSQQKNAFRDHAATLLDLQVDLERDPDLIPLVISYQTHVLRIIARQSNVAVIYDAICNLRREKAHSPLQVLLRYSKLPNCSEKAIRHLENLATNTSGLAPVPSQSADAIASDPALSPSPVVAFELQCLALETQLELWKLAGHQIDADREVLQPYYNCLAAALRRTTASASVGDLFALSTKFYAKVQTVASGVLDSNDTTMGYAIHKSLSTLAERASQASEAAMWTAKAERNSQSAESSARQISIHIHRALRAMTTCAIDEDILKILDAARTAMKHGISGTSQDYDMLASDLADFAQKSIVLRKEMLRASRREICAEAAAFATRLARTYPDRDVKDLLLIVETAVADSESTQFLMKWVSKHTFMIFKRAGVVREIALQGAVKSLHSAWSSSRHAITLGRLIKTLVTRTYKQGTSQTEVLELDDENFDTIERGILLEWQLRCTLELARKTRYDQGTRTMAAEVLQSLEHVYSSSKFPLRHARTRLIAMQLKLECPDFLLPQSWYTTSTECTIDLTQLEFDSGLVAYAADATAMTAIFRIVLQGQPSIEQLRPHLRVWQSLLQVCSESHPLVDVVENPDLLATQLSSLTQYFMAVGEASAALPAALLQVRLGRAANFSKAVQLSNLAALARIYLACQLVESARAVLDDACGVLQSIEDNIHVQMEISQLRLCQASCSLLAGDLSESQSYLNMAKGILLGPRSGASEKRNTRLLIGEAWLVNSQLAHAMGAYSQALGSAKRAVKSFNAVWTMLNKECEQQDPTQITEPELDSVAAKIRKLNLSDAKSKTSDSLTSTHLQGAGKWPIVPSLCTALLHLSIIYSQHGVFHEAKYYSEQALKIADAMGPCELLARIRYYRCSLFVAGGLLEDAELCLAMENQKWRSPSMIKVEQLQAKAAVAAKNGSLEESIVLLKDAEQEITNLAAEASQTDKKSADVCADLKMPTPKDGQVIRSKSTKELKSSKPRSTSQRARAKTVDAADAVSNENAPVLPVALGKLRTRIIYVRMSLEVHANCSAVNLMPSLTIAGNRALAAEIQHVKMQTTLSETVAAVAEDASSMLLQESTLAMPAIFSEDAFLLSKPRKTARKPVKASESHNVHVPLVNTAQKELHTMWERFVSTRTLVASHNTAAAHFEASMLCQLSMLMTITSRSPLEPHIVAYAIEYARMNATQKYACVATSDREHAESQSQLESIDASLASVKEVMSENFQEQYVDMLPETWTAVSMSLNADKDELCLTRYRCSQPPLVVRLPFARHKPDADEDEPFNFMMGREELGEIIELSNYSCHNAGDTSVKGAKSKWWSEREVLDRRLQELLINIENLWLGGFKGILSDRRPPPDALSKFRKAFHAMLNRHLPSRQSQKRGRTRLSVDDQILELFVNLGADAQDDLDEALSDLLYFVVDMLQLKGESNAYDEIDFDAAVVEITDALQFYHDDLANNDPSRGHLILVLDRRLHAFPWESMPYLEGMSVSRVDSMVTLHDRILEIRARNSQSLTTKGDLYTITRNSGCYILNPSKDLAATQTMLAPSLSKLQSSDNKWTSIIRRAPSEDEFVSVLSNSAVTLYFGHGAGSQYIRTRAVRRLERCSEVVWLMGCSSGAATEYDALEPFIVPLAYLVAGQGPTNLAPGEALHSESPTKAGVHKRSKCMAVVAMLWDVTDKDIDRFSLAVGEEWGLWDAAPETTVLPAKTPKKRETVAVYSTPLRQPKTPKTPKVRPMPAESRTPARSRSRARDRVKGQHSLVDAVARNRDACYLRYLNGAAPVVYGVPVYLES